MLKEVIIDNIALIEHLVIGFRGGLSAMTGETGAGKSIVLDAIGLLLGGRASTDLVRSGTDGGQVLGLFELPRNDELQALWAEHGLLWPEDEQLVITREINVQGKSSARINGRPVALATLRSITRHLVELHGQHEHQALFDPRLHLSILDQFGGSDHHKVLDDYRSSFAAWLSCSEEIDRLEMDEREQIRLADLWRFQLGEISDAKLKLGEDEHLLAMRSRLSNAERLYSACQSAYQTIYVGAGRQSSALDTLHRVESDLSVLGRLDPEIAPLQQQFMDCLYQLEDVARALGNYQESVVFDPDQLAKVEER
ncbi:MAG: AAA family ATPase, partial [Bacillota bacterium]